MMNGDSLIMYTKGFESPMNFLCQDLYLDEVMLKNLDEDGITMVAGNILLVTEDYTLLEYNLEDDLDFESILKYEGGE